MATLHDVAQRAGVSLSTASYALSGSRPVSERTRKRIIEAMQELQYVPNESARTLARGRSRTIALMMPSSFNPLDGTLAAILDAASRAAIARNYRLSLWSEVEELVEPSGVAGLARSIKMSDAVGVMLMEVLMHDDRVAWLHNAEVPAVLIGRTEVPHSYLSVDIHFEQAVSDAVDLLRAQGHHAIGMVNHSTLSLERGYGPTVRSLTAFTEATGAENSLKHVCCDETPLAGEHAAQQLLAQFPELTALLVMNERASFGVQRGLINLGRSDVSLVTVASSPGVSELAHPTFASFDINAAVMGATAVNALIDDVEGLTGPAVSSREQLIECMFVPGQSLKSGH
ncbi:LacI family DNA-binding transcriptional regulator [Timonella sp. A28]|uniref:LacI family DNA-binding transcriptional regulator n=1 Tax=Timonella sp. A28 TaxID=3442640 RepID=UPI003EBA15D2